MRHYLILTSVFVGFLGLIAFSSCASNHGEVQEDLGEKVEERTLNFYALNDFHGAYLYDEAQEQTGLSCIGEFLINQKENDPENTFILSSGDMFQGGAESNITKGSVVIESMNAIGFDSMTVGNHEFDWGEETLKSMAEQMNFPLLGINVFYETDDLDNLIRPSFLSPSTIVKKEGIKVGIIGSIMQNIDDSIIATIADDFYYANSQDLIRNEAERLRNEENCDVVVLSTHDGSYYGYEDLTDVIDAVFLGHDHNKVNGKFENGVPYVEGMNYGTYLSHISLDLKLNSSNHYEVVSTDVENIDTFNNFTEESEEVNEVYAKYENNIVDIRDEVLYVFERNISKSVFGNFIAKSLLDYSNNILDVDYDVSMGAINSGGGVRSNVLAGEFTYGDLIKVYPFENALCILQIDPSNYYRFYYTGTGLYKSFEVEDSQLPIINDDGFSYVATVDYVAYQDSYPKEKIIPFEDVLCRDIVATQLKDMLENEIEF